MIYNRRIINFHITCMEATHIILSTISLLLHEMQTKRSMVHFYEDITACSIINSKDKCNILANIPWHLHSVIWKAYLRDKFYSLLESVSHYNMLELSEFSILDLSDLSELLHHWPKEEFTLRDVMPRFPSKLCLWTHFFDQGRDRSWLYGYGPPLHRTRTLLQQFYHYVSDAVIESFIKTESNNFGNTHKDGGKIRKVDISGFAFMWFNKGKYGNPLKYIESVENPFVNSHDKFEFIIDAEITLKHDKIVGKDEQMFSRDDDEYDTDIEDEEDLNIEELRNDNNDDEKNIKNEDTEDMDENKSLSLSTSHANISNSVLSYGTLGILTYKCTKQSVKIIKKMISERTRSIYIGELPIDAEQFINNVFEFPFKQNVMTLGLCSNVNSLNFVHYFTNLKHLDLSKQNLNGKLDPLLHMEKGLCFLDLSACKLSHSDLDILLKSCHKSSLLELNISRNNFNDNSTNLIKLCQVLPSLIIFHLEGCNLFELSANNLRYLCDSFNSLPNLSYLNLHWNEFGMDIVKSHLIALSACPSLKILLLDEAEDEHDSSLITAMMNQNRSELLYIQAGGYF